MYKVTHKLLPNIGSFLWVLLFFTFFQAKSQDSVVITKYIYVGSMFNEPESIYETEKFLVTSKDNMQTLLEDCSGQNRNEGIDSNWIKKKPEDLLKLHSKEQDFAWNTEQREFIYPKLKDLNNYEIKYKEYLFDGASYTMHNSYKKEWIISFYKNDKIFKELKSRKYVWGFLMPWTTATGDTIFNHNIESDMFEMASTNEKPTEILQGKKLLKYLIARIIDSYTGPLYSLSAFSYMDDINNLKKEFNIVSMGEVQGRGRYIWNEPRTIKIVLKNNLMFDNTSIVFMDSQNGSRLYSSDSIKKDYKDYIRRIQSIEFISDYLKFNPSSKLEIYYFNNRGINEYNIDQVNKNPKTWKQQDDYVESMKWYERSNIKPSFDISDAIATSKQNNCGCDFRFDRSYIEKAIFFEITDTNKNSSIWFLLPDDRLLLYILDHETAVNFKRSDFKPKYSGGLIYPYILVDFYGHKIEKEHD